MNGSGCDKLTSSNKNPPDYHSKCNANIKEFFKRYTAIPNLRTIGVTSAFCEDWLEYICDDNELWPVKGEDFKSTHLTNNTQRVGLIKDFESNYGHSPALLHDWVLTFTDLRTQLKDARVEHRGMSSKLSAKTRQIESLNSNLDEALTEHNKIWNELFRKLEPRSQQYLLNNHIGPLANRPKVTKLPKLHPFSTSRCSITSPRIHPFNSNNNNTFALEQNSPFSNVVVGWDKADESQDSCRVVLGENHAVIALCDGVSSRDSSGLYSSLITDALTRHFVYTMKNSLLFSRGIVNEFLREKIELIGPRTLLFDMVEEFATRMMDNLDNGQGTLIQIIIHSEGLAQFHRLGDSCLWLIKGGSELMEISQPDDVDDAATEYIGSGMRLSQPKLDAGFIELSRGDVLFACTDQVASWVTKNKPKFMAWYRECIQSSDLANKFSTLFELIDKETNGNDHQTIVLYTHTNTNLENTDTQITVNYRREQGQLDFNGNCYTKRGDKPYFFDSVTFTGLKLLPSLSIFLNLTRLSYGPDLGWLLPFKPLITTIDGEQKFFIEMEHLTLENGYIELSTIDWNTYDDQNVVNMLPEMPRLLRDLRQRMDQSNFTHRDIALDNMFYCKSDDKLILIDHNSVYTHGFFTGYSSGNGYDEEAGHVGCYGPNDKQFTTNIFHQHSHRFPLKMLEITFDLLNNVKSPKDYERMMLNAADGTIVFLEDEIARLFSPKKDKSDITERIGNHVQFTSEELEKMFDQLTYPGVFLDADGDL